MGEAAIAARRRVWRHVALACPLAGPARLSDARPLLRGSATRLLEQVRVLPRCVLPPQGRLENGGLLVYYCQPLVWTYTTCTGRTGGDAAVCSPPVQSPAHWRGEAHLGHGSLPPAPVP